MYNNSKFAILMPLIIAVAVSAGIFIGIFSKRGGQPAGVSSISAISAPRDKISATASLIEKYYVDPIDLNEIAETVLPVMVGELDPHSVYIPARDMLDANMNLDGEFDGIGVEFNMSTDTVVILNVITAGPSDQAGVKNGDRIIKINDTIVAGQKMNQADVVKKLRGARGTTVDLGIMRSGISQLVPITVTRGVIPVKSLDAAFMITPEAGFIKLSAFSRNSYREMMAALADLSAEGMKELIFDLRGNSGGFLDQAILIANEFLPADKLIVYTVDKRKRRTEEYSNGGGSYQHIPMTILIDEGSASSSEILAGAIQDNDRGTIIGRRSYGKGLVQQQLPFTDGSALRLTIARYYTPTGRSIQKPYSEGAEEYNNELLSRYEHSEMFTADSIHFDESLMYETPKGKIVYGGGGIMPDVFVPLDTTDMTRYYIEVTGRNILYRYTMEYSDRHREKINSISTVSELNAFLDADRNLLGGFVSYAASQGVVPDWKQIRISEKLILAQLRAYIGRNTPLRDVGFYSSIYPVDNVLLKAIEILQEEQSTSSGQIK